MIAETKAEVSIFGSFHLDETELVLGIESLQEVVPFPDRITKMPLAPDHLLGFFNLRGEIVPVVNLKRILGSEQSAPTASQKVAIVECEGARIGLLFDSTGEVLRVRDEARCDFRYRGDGADAVHRVLSGALKLEGGARVLQILDASAILKVENIPQIVEWQNRDGGAARRRGRLRAHLQKCISFRCGGARLGFEMKATHEIVRVPAIQKSVLKSEICLGMIPLRDRVIPVIDFSRFLGGTPTSLQAPERRIIVMQREETLFGLLVDAVENIVSYSEEEVIPIPVLAQSHARIFKGCIPGQGSEDIILLDPVEVCSDAEMLKLTEGHNHLYQAQAGADAAQGTETAASRERQVYISFTLGHLFGLPIQHVHEIIGYPKQLLQAPGRHPFVAGLINLRGEIVTVVDTRILYGIPKGESITDQTKVLILKRTGGEKIGFVVDTLESILTATADERTGVSNLLLQKLDGAFRSDIAEIVQMEGAGEAKKAVLILNPAGLLRRVEEPSVS